MTTGFRVGATDLDQIFEQRISGDPTTSSTGFRISATDLNQRYCPLSMGQIRPSDTGYRVGTTDLRNLFAAVGTVSRWPTPLPWQRTLSSVDVQTIPNFATATAECRFEANGNLVTIDTQDGNVNRGFVLPVGSTVNQFEIRAVQTFGPVALQNDMVNFVPLGTLRRIIYSVTDTQAGVVSEPEDQVGQFDITIRQISNPSNSATGQLVITLYAETLDNPV